jgi:hypothetical protein
MIYLIKINIYHANFIGCNDDIFKWSRKDAKRENDGNDNLLNFATLWG